MYIIIYNYIYNNLFIIMSALYLILIEAREKKQLQGSLEQFSIFLQISDVYNHIKISLNCH